MDSVVSKCSTCDSKDIFTFCPVCKEIYCDDCSERHGHLGATKDHCTINISSGEIRKPKEASLNCSPCKGRNIVVTATFFCMMCLELLCEKCHLFHSKTRITKQHGVTKLSRDGQTTTTKAPSKMA